MADLLRGKPVADEIKEDVRTRAGKLRDADNMPGLAIVRLGDRPDDIAYENSVLRVASDLGINTTLFSLAATTTQAELLDAIHSINEDDTIDGCLMFRPLPAPIDELTVCNALAPAKDVDGIGAASLAGVFMGLPEGFAPATAEACMRILDFHGIDLEGKHVVVVGRSLVIGKPVAMLLCDRHATVTLAHSRTADLPSLTRAADIVVCATGRAKMFGVDYFSAEQIVLDVGMNVDEDGALCGDVDTNAVAPVVSAITPVPGGVGSVTTAVLLEHVVRATEAAHGSETA